MSLGPMQFIVDGVDQTVNTLKNITIALEDGHQVDVGSGFSFEEREYFKANPKKILHKTVKISFFEESRDKTGKPSLRFPCFKGVLGVDRKV